MKVAEFTKLLKGRPPARASCGATWTVIPTGYALERSEGAATPLPDDALKIVL